MKLCYHDQSDTISDKNQIVQYVTDRIGLVYVETKTELLGPIWSESVMKTTQNHNMIDHIGVVYVKNETKLSCLIRSGVVYDENKTA